MRRTAARESVQFVVVRAAEDGADEWLRADRTWGAQKEEAAAFEFYVDPTGRERLQIDDAIRRDCGGREQAARLYAEQALVRESVIGRLRATLEQAERELLDRSIENGRVQIADLLGPLEADPLHRSEVMLLVDLDEQLAVLNLLAEWVVLRRAVPPGWEDLGDLPLPAETMTAVTRAYRRALGGARATAGKGQSPPS